MWLSRYGIANRLRCVSCCCQKSLGLQPRSPRGGEDGKAIGLRGELNAQAQKAALALGQDNFIGHLGLRVRGTGGDEVRAEAVAEMAGRLTSNLTGFAQGALQLDERLNWSATAGLRWRF